MQLEPYPATSPSFVTEIELWSPLDTAVWDRVVVDRFGLRSERVQPRLAARGTNRIALRAIGSGRAEVGTNDDGAGYGLEIALPYYGDHKMDALVVLRCNLESARAGCVEIWEPSSIDELSHAEGFYGLLSDFELSSRLARFRFGSGLPGIAWEKRRPHLIADVRNTPTFLRAALALAHGLSLGVAIPIVRGSDVSQVVTILTAVGSPLSPAVEVWTPDGGDRLWLEDAVYAPAHTAIYRTMKITCFMRGEGIVGRAFASRRPVLWSRRQSDAREIDAEARASAFDQVVAIPTFDAGKIRSVFVLRS